MTDKTKTQIELELGDIEYVTDPNYVPPRKVDQLRVSCQLEPEHFFEILRPHLELGTLDFNWGEYEGETIILLHEWDTVYEIIGLLNGFEGLGDKPYISEGKTLKDVMYGLLANHKNTDPNHFGTLSRIETSLKKCEKWIEYNKFMSDNEYEELGFDDFNLEYVFSDEYNMCCCGNCSNIVRTSPDSYSWVAPLNLNNEGYIADECACDGDFDNEILEEYANKSRALPEIRSPDDLGLIKINTDSFENGLYGGQNDTPEPIIESLNDVGIDVWFIVHPGQFDVSFDVYVLEADKDKAIEVLSGTDTKLDYDPAVRMSEALQNISIPSNTGEGIPVTTVDASTGTANTKIISKQDFIDGKALK